jgi:hypothetical protein
MELWQRCNSCNILNMKYTADRWVAHRTSYGNVTIRQKTSPIPTVFRTGWRLKPNAGDSVLDPIRLEQSVEVRNAVRLRNETVTVSFFVRMGANFNAALFKAELISGTGTDALALSTGFAGEVLVGTVTAQHHSVWQRVSTTVMLATDITQLALRFTYAPDALAGNEDWCDITGVQLEAGANTTRYEFLDYAIGLIRAQRYYEKSFAPDVPPIQNSGDTGNAARVPQLVGALAGMFASIDFTVEKRTAPSIAFYNPVAANAQMRNRTNNQNCTSTTALDIGTKGMAPFCITPSGSSAGQQLIVHYSADAELY